MRIFLSLTGEVMTFKPGPLVHAILVTEGPRLVNIDIHATLQEMFVGNA